jgi:glycosyltransferase involved in cell wall biosynthesis
LPALGVSVERLAVEDGCCSSARLYNVAAERVAEDLVLFLSGDTEVTEPKWLSRLAGYLSLPGVGATGARLVSHNGRILTAGKVLGMRNGLAPGDAFAGWPDTEPTYYFQAEIARPCSAVSSACLLMSRKVFLEIGGFDERRYPDGLHDVDLCLRLAQRGERTLCVGSAQLVHHTGEFAVSESGPAALAEFRRDHGHRKDPYYNRNLSAVETYQIDTGCHLDYESYADQPVSTLLVTHNLNLEGAPRVLWKLAVGLNRRAKVRSKVYSPLAGAAEKWFRGSAVEISIQPLPKCRNVLEGWMSRDDYEASVQAMQHLLQQEQPAVVIANTLNSFYAVDAAKRSGIPSIWIIHESYTRERMSQAINPCVLASCEKAFADAYRVVFVSTDTMRLYQQYNGTQNFVVLHNGIDALPIDQYIAQVAKPEAARRTDAPANKKLIVSVGTVCERKSQLTLVQAAELLRERRADFCCYIVGLREGDSYSEYVRRCVRQKKLEDVVRLVPETDQVYQYLRAADMFVLASHIEAFSLSILEAEAFALPIITTPCHGISEQVHHEVNALMFNMSDPESLARHIATLLDDAQRCAQMGRDSRLVFEGLCTHEEMLERYERLVLGAWMRGPCRPATV